MSDRVSGETLRDWAGDAYAKDEASDDELRAMARELLDARARIAELEKMLAAMEAQYWEAWREPLRARLALAEEVVEAVRLDMDQSLGEDAGFVMPATTSALDRYDAARKETT